MKKIIALILCFITLFTVTITAYASEIAPYSNNVYTTDVSFNIPIVVKQLHHMNIKEKPVL